MQKSKESFAFVETIVRHHRLKGIRIVKAHVLIASYSSVSSVPPTKGGRKREPLIQLMDLRRGNSVVYLELAPNKLDRWACQKVTCPRQQAVEMFSTRDK